MQRLTVTRYLTIALLGVMLCITAVKTFHTHHGKATGTQWTHSESYAQQQHSCYVCDFAFLHEAQPRYMQLPGNPARQVIVLDTAPALRFLSACTRQPGSRGPPAA